jgi:hypothetical protein
MFAVPGQHDLPYHRMEDLMKSSFWTLVEAKVIAPIPMLADFESNPLYQYDFIQMNDHEYPEDFRY